MTDNTVNMAIVITNVNKAKQNNFRDKRQNKQRVFMVRSGHGNAPSSYNRN
jgi:hypothetical protein